MKFQKMKVQSERLCFTVHIRNVLKPHVYWFLKNPLRKALSLQCFCLFWVFPFSVSRLVRDELIRVVVMDGNTHSSAFCSQALICMLIVSLENNRASLF